jgi:malate dehydrogenase (oxaloacetate-decarboxylating)
MNFNMNYFESSIDLHRKFQGKLAIQSLVPLETRDDLSLAYTPGVAAPSEAIAKDRSLAYELTMKGRTVAIVTDGSAVLGLGNIGPEAGLPVMEGKAILFKRFANIDAFPLCLATQNSDEIVETVKRIAPGFGAIQLEDIAAPRCFEIEERLIRELDVPVMHDDQHGTAVVILAGLLNALRVVEKSLKEVKIVISGSGAAGLASGRLLWDAGARFMTMIDSQGILAMGRNGMNAYKDEFAQRINPENKQGTLTDAIQGADVFIGVSKANLVTSDMVRSMAKDPIIFAMANPSPEIMPDIAKEAGAAVIATGRSDFPNQVNNVLVFPGMFLGVLEGRLPKFTNTMRLAAAHALAGMVEHPTRERILPSALETDVARIVADAIKRA